MLMAWCFSTRASVATVLTTHPCVSRCLRVKVGWIRLWSRKILNSWPSLWECYRKMTIWSKIVYRAAVTKGGHNVRFWTHKRYCIPGLWGWAMGCLLWEFWKNMTWYGILCCCDAGELWGGISENFKESHVLGLCHINLKHVAVSWQKW